MTSPFATNSVLGKNRCGNTCYLPVDENNRPLDGQIPRTYQIYNGNGGEFVQLEGKDFLIVTTDIPSGALTISTGGAEGNRNFYGRVCNLIFSKGTANNVSLTVSPGTLYVNGVSGSSSNYTISANSNPFTVCLNFTSITEVHASINNYSGNGMAITDNTTSGSVGLEYDDGTNNITVTNTPTVQTITATSSMVTGTFNADTVVASATLTGNTVNVSGSLFLQSVPTLNATENNLLVRNSSTGEVDRRNARNLPNFYNNDDKVSGDRIVDMNGNQLSILSGSDLYAGFTRYFLGTTPANDDTATRIMALSGSNQFLYRNVSSFPHIDSWTNVSGTVTNQDISGMRLFNGYVNSSTGTATIHVTEDGLSGGTGLFTNLANSFITCSGARDTTLATEVPIVAIKSITTNTIVLNIFTVAPAGLQANSSDVRVHVTVVGLI